MPFTSAVKEESVTQFTIDFKGNNWFQGGEYNYDRIIEALKNKDLIEDGFLSTSLRIEKKKLANKSRLAPLYFFSALLIPRYERRGTET